MVIPIFQTVQQKLQGDKYSPGTKKRGGINIVCHEGGVHRVIKLNIPCDSWVKTKKIYIGFSIFSFCEEVWPKQKYTQFMWGIMEACENGVSGS